MARLHEHSDSPLDVSAVFHQHLLGISGEESARTKSEATSLTPPPPPPPPPNADKGNDVAMMKEEIELLKAEKAQALQTIEKLERTIAELRSPASHSPAPAVSPSVRQPAYTRTQ